MRIVSCLSTPVRASEAYILTQAEALASLGAEVTILEAQRPAGEPEPRATTIPFMSLPISPVRPPRRLVARSARALQTALTGSASRLTRKDKATWLQALHDLNPDVVLVQFGPSAVRLHPVLNQLALPWGVQFHGYDATVALAQWSYRRALGTTLRDADFVFACSQFIASQVQPYASGTPVHVVTPGTKLIPAIRTAREQEHPFRLVCVARLVPVKGHHQLIEALALSEASVHLTLIGDGALRSDMELLAARLGLLPDRLTFMGQIPPEKLSEIFSSADAFIQCSTLTPEGALEGLGLTAIEAAMSGLPVILTDSGGLAETCIDGETGTVVPDGDIGAIAAAINRLASNPDLCARMGKRGRAFAARFDHLAQARNALRMFRELA